MEDLTRIDIQRLVAYFWDIRELPAGRYALVTENSYIEFMITFNKYLKNLVSQKL